MFVNSMPWSSTNSSEAEASGCERRVWEAIDQIGRMDSREVENGSSVVKLMKGGQVVNN